MKLPPVQNAITFWLQFFKSRQRIERVVRAKLNVEEFEPRIAMSTVQNFDLAGAGSTYVLQQYQNGPAPQILDGGPTGAGKYLEGASGNPVPNPPIHNTISFNLTDAGAFDQISAEWYFRITPVNLAGDGYAIAFLNTDIYGTTGAIGGGAEEGNFAQSFAIGFDTYPNNDLKDVSDRSVSLHWDGKVAAQMDTTNLIDFANGKWIHVKAVIRFGGGLSDATVILTQQPDAGDDPEPVVIFDRYKVEGLVPYQSRVHLGYRNGGAAGKMDSDNIDVRFGPLPHSLAFEKVVYEPAEDGGNLTVNVVRTGSTIGTATVIVSTVADTATAGSDYTTTEETLTFGPGETVKTVSIPILDDATKEDDEIFELRLSNPTGGVELGHGSVAKVSILDDETSRISGRWGKVFSTEIVAVHAHLLPDGRILLWPGDEGEGDDHSEFENPQIYDPVNGSLRELPPPPHNLFCAAASFLSDGRLLVTGGHLGLAEGLPDAAVFDFITEKWTVLPKMNEGRWYPTNTTLPNGDVLVVSGAVQNEPYKVNPLPQVWEWQSGIWRDLADAEFDMHLYPFMFVAPNGMVFNAGPNQDTQYLDTSGGGEWIDVANSNFGVRTDGTAALYDNGKIVIIGGSTGAQTPTKTAEIIDLTADTPKWTYTDEMEFARKYATAVNMPDGTVTIVGGTSSAGFNDSTDAVLAAENWDPSTGNWTTWADMAVSRVYHSTALLLPDGRIFAAGGGQPSVGPGAHANNRNAEIFSPPYMFKERPEISTAPQVAGYGETIFAGTDQAGEISEVALIRLGTVTHAYNHDQRFVSLSFTVSAGGLNVAIPDDAAQIPPGHYMLFILQDGVPSVSKPIQISHNPAHDLDRALGLRFWQSLYENYGGKNGRWMLGRNNDWYVILENGEVLRWDGTPFTASGERVATLQPVYWTRPKLLYDADLEPLPYVLDQAFGLKQIGGVWHQNYGGANGKWIGGNDNLWFFILPNGEFYLWDGTPNTASGRLLGTLDPAFYDDPFLLADAKHDHAPLHRAYELDQRYGLEVNGGLWQNFGGKQDKWLYAPSTGDWFFILPNGDFYQWGRTPQAATGVLVATLHPFFWERPELIYNAADRSLEYVLDDALGLAFPGSAWHQNYGGKNGKWMLGSDSLWYYILPSGEFYRWDGTPNTAAGTLLATLDPAFYDDPNKLVNAAN